MGTEWARAQLVGRLRVLSVLFLLPFLFLMLLLWHVQVRHGDEHQETIRHQSVRRLRLPPVRGRILARDNTVLVANRTVYDAVFHVSEMRQPGRRSRSRTIEHILTEGRRLCFVLQRDSTLTERQLRRHIRSSAAMPLPVATDLSTVELARAAELLPPIRGLELTLRLARRYTRAGFATHVLGFTGRDRPETPGRGIISYAGSEMLGRNGIEREYDAELAGEGGAQLVRVDTLGYVRAEIEPVHRPKDGNDLVLTLDVTAQTAADRIMAGVSGALVAVAVRSGAVLAMTSSPSYDLTQLTGATYAVLRADTTGRPLVNRAVSFGYTPGSIVKPLIALAALNAATIESELAYECTGALVLGSKRIRCWRRSGHGPLNLVQAIANSCNPYFMDAGLETGLARIAPLLAAAGIGQRPGIDLPHAEAGLLPSRAFARRRWSRNWIAVDTAYLAIGQGAISLSPLQAALYTAALANGGRVLRPYLVQSVVAPGGIVVRNNVPVVERRLPVSELALALVKQGMSEAVAAPHGTAAALRIPEIELAGKTGTAEVGVGADRHNDTWVVCYGPVPNPRYAVAVVVERGESGGRTAAPRAARFFRAWLSAGGLETAQR